MTEVTDEMVEAFGAAWHTADAELDGGPSTDGYRRRAGIAAVLAIVDRDAAARAQRAAGRPVFRDGDGDPWWLTNYGRYVFASSQEAAEAQVEAALRTRSLDFIGFATVDDVRAKYGEMD
jgi:hypothetical protein